MRDPLALRLVALGGAAVEPLLFGVRAMLVGMAVWFGLNRAPELLGLGTYDYVVVSTANEMTTVSMAWLLVPVQSMLVMLAQASARVLALMSAATGRWRYFTAAFIYIALFDAVVSWPRLAERLVFTPMWSVTLALAPISVLGLYMLYKTLAAWLESSAGMVEAKAFKRGRVEA